MTDTQKKMTQLADWQLAFVSKYLADNGQRARLISSPGMGKTTVAQHTGHELLRLKRNSNMLVISPHRALVHQWRMVGEGRGVAFVDSAERLRDTSVSGISVSAQQVLRSELGSSLVELGETASFFIIIDDAHDAKPPLVEYVERLLAANTQSRSLALFRSDSTIASSHWDEFIGSEYFFEPRSILLPESRLEVARLSPSYSVLHTLLAKSGNVDDLHWRLFEKLIAELLEADGYEVELMEGTKDGGVDVIAIKDLGPLGLFKTLWQAKKKQLGNKVGLSVVRELADTRDEFGASKAFIVTSTFLTRGAAQRIQRDRYQLGKVDRDDLDVWINRILRGR